MPLKDISKNNFPRKEFIILMQERSGHWIVEYYKIQ